MSMSEAGGPTNPQEAGDAAFLRPVVVAIHGIGNPGHRKSGGNPVSVRLFGQE
jgi:hypothetical protein